MKLDPKAPTSTWLPPLGPAASKALFGSLMLGLLAQTAGESGSCACPCPTTGGDKSRKLRPRSLGLTAELSSAHRQLVPNPTPDVGTATNFGQQPRYGKERMAADLKNALQSRPSMISRGYLGNPANWEKWDAARITELYTGIRNVNRLFYPQFDIQTLSRLLIAESCQESTGDFALGVRPINFHDGSAQGLIQVTPRSVLLDYKNHGLPITDDRGNVLLDPKDAPNLNLGNPRTNILLWGWYTRNSLAFGISIREWINREAWGIATGKVTRDFGNAQLTWLAGPHNDRHTNMRNNAGWIDYRNRMADYAAQGGFFDVDAFEKLQSTPVDNGPVLINEDSRDES